jgi:predicted HTH domain antitoxin
MLIALRHNQDWHVKADFDEYVWGRSVMTTHQITFEVPEKVLLAEKTDAATFARELRVLAAVKLYELGRLSSGRAAELADLPRVEFLLVLGRYQVFPFLAELNELEQTHG